MYKKEIELLDKIREEVIEKETETILRGQVIHWLTTDKIGKCYYDSREKVYLRVISPITRLVNNNLYLCLVFSTNEEKIETMIDVSAMLISDWMSKYTEISQEEFDVELNHQISQLRDYLVNEDNIYIRKIIGDKLKDEVSCYKDLGYLLDKYDKNGNISMSELMKLRGAFRDLEDNHLRKESVLSESRYYKNSKGIIANISGLEPDYYFIGYDTYDTVITSKAPFRLETTLNIKRTKDIGDETMQFLTKKEFIKELDRILYRLRYNLYYEYHEGIIEDVESVK